jgi:hypothetical protein
MDQHRGEVAWEKKLSLLKHILISHSGAHTKLTMLCIQDTLEQLEGFGRKTALILSKENHYVTHLLMVNRSSTCLKD